MRWTYFILLQAVIILVVATIAYQHQDRVTLVKTPPTELAQWYKPENKRQVWLHNMFKLRREMQAVELYANNQDEKHLAQWSEQLSEHYVKIADMVPKWRKKLNVRAMSQLSEASKAQDYEKVLTQLGEIQQSCDSCHDDFQAITALTYRAPDFSKTKVTEQHSFVQHMDSLTKQVNQIKISAQDGFTELALLSVDELDKSMNELGQVCSDCHKKDSKSYPDETMNKTLASLKTSISSGTLKEQGRYLGTLAVLACARCHGTHRIAYGAKEKLVNGVDYSELIKHK